MTDTPETDELKEDIWATPYVDGQDFDLMVDHARKLERERNDLREIFPMILVSLKSGACAATCSVDFLRKIPKEVRLVRERLERERDEAREQRDRLAEALWSMLNQDHGSAIRAGILLRSLGLQYLNQPTES